MNSTPAWGSAPDDPTWQDLPLPPVYEPSSFVDAATPGDVVDAELVGEGCPRCGSHSPALHPAVQAEGEVHTCPDPFHGPLPDDGLNVPEQALLPVQLAQGGARAVALFREPDAVRALSRDLQGSLRGRLRSMDAELRAARLPGRLTASIVAPELQLWADAYETLDAISKAFGAGAQEVRGLAGEVVAEVEPDKVKGSSSVRVGDGHGADVKVTRTQGTEARVDTAKVLDVLVAGLLAEEEAEGGRTTQHLAWYAAGARDTLKALQQLVSPLKWKTTALDAWARRLDDAGQHGLAIRLGHAYGRVAKGDPQVKIERVEPSKRGGTA